MMDAIKGTMTEIYNDLSKNTTASTIAEVRDGTCLPHLLRGFYGLLWWRPEEASLEITLGSPSSLC